MYMLIRWSNDLEKLQDLDMTLSMVLGAAAAKAFECTPNFLHRRILFNTSLKHIN